MRKSRPSDALVVALLLVGAAVSCGQAAQPSAKQQEAKLIAVLQSDAKLKEKADACRQLARLGTKDAVPALAALLGDEKLSHMARYGLEPIPDPAVDDALRQALGKLRGRPLVGVIGSIGVRRDAKATDALTRLLGHANADVAQAAARALGKIGTPAAAKALDGALAKVPKANQLAFCEGLFRCAEALVAKGQRDEATAIYDRLRGLRPAPHQVHAGALRGAVLTRGKAGLPLLLEAIRGDDFAMVAAAARAAMEMPGPEVTQALADELGKVPVDKQILLTQTLGKRADARALPALFALAKRGGKHARVAALRALPEIGNAAAIPVLTSLLGDAEREVAQAARESLAALSGSQVDVAVVAMLKHSDPGTRRLAVELIGRRRVLSAIPALLTATEDADRSIRVASLKVLGELAGPAQVPAMLAILAKAKAPAEAQAAEAALTALCVRQADRAACADKLLAAVAAAPGRQKLPLLRVLRSVGGPKALQAVRTATTQAEIRDAAISLLCGWPTPEALPDVTRLAKTSTEPNVRILALRGYIRLSTLRGVPVAKKLGALKEALALAKRKEEKKLALAALGAIHTPGALALVTPHLSSADVKEEASLAAVAIAERIIRRHPAPVAEAMRQVVAATASRQTAARARRLLQRAQRAAPRR